METFGKKRSLKLDTRLRISSSDYAQVSKFFAVGVGAGGVGVGVAGDKMVSLKRSPHC